MIPHAFVDSLLHHAFPADCALRRRAVIGPYSIGGLYSSRFDSDGIIYRQSVCTNEEMELIRKEVSQAMKHLTKERSSIAQHRLGTTISQDSARGSDIIQVLQKGSIFSFVDRVVDANDRVQLSDNIPVEIRVYECSGASMTWHQDDVLYDPAQIEVVFTVDNTSNCETMWKIGKDLHIQETHPNSILLLKAGGPEHCVSSLKWGKRVILKCAYKREGAEFIGMTYKNQFGIAKQTRKNTKGKSKR
jgi:hypothetical protein